MTATRGHRFQLLITPASQLFMLPFGVTSRRAYAQVLGDVLHVRFGPMFDERIPLANIKGAEIVKWPRLAGVGPRTDFRGRVALIGSFDNTVRLTLKEAMNSHVFVVPVTLAKLYLSLEDPNAFVAEVGGAHHPKAKAA